MESDLLNVTESFSCIAFRPSEVHLLKMPKIFSYWTDTFRMLPNEVHYKKDAKYKLTQPMESQSIPGILKVSWPLVRDLYSTFLFEWVAHWKFLLQCLTVSVNSYSKSGTPGDQKSCVGWSK